MPLSVIVEPLNKMLSDPTAQAYRDATAAVAGATSVLGAVTATGLLGTLRPAVMTEAQAVLGSLPAAIDLAIMTTLGSAFDRKLPVTVAWVEDLKIAVRIWEQPEGPVSILFMSPNGLTFI